MAEEDLYRLGNSTSPRLDYVRDTDVDMYSTNGILFVRANGKGISLLTEDGARGKRGGWLWKLPARSPLPPACYSITTPRFTIHCAPRLI
jgi:hypothetical protein